MKNYKLNNELNNKLNNYNWDLEEILSILPSNSRITDCDENYIYFDNKYRMNVTGDIEEL